MSEFSLPFPDTTTPGPQVGNGRPYTDAEWRNVWRALFSGAAPDLYGVLWLHSGGLLGRLQVTSPGANQIQVDSGMACVDGAVYTLDAPKALAVASASAGSTRQDRVVLQGKWSVGAGQYEVLASIKQGTQAAPPTLTQTTGSVWEISLARFTVNDVGAISALTDERQYLHMATRVSAAMCDDDVATQAELDAHTGATSAHGSSGSVVGQTTLNAHTGATSAHGSSGAVVGQTTLNTHKTSSDHDGRYFTEAEADARFAPTAKGVTNGNSHDHAGGDGAQISTPGIANDAVDDTKVGNRVPQFRRRQGGSGTNWSLQGTTTYTVGAVRMQAGTARWTGSAASSGGLTVTFPEAFSAFPIVIVTPNHSGVNVAYTVNSAAAANLSWRTLDESTLTSIDFFWLAIGPE